MDYYLLIMFKAFFFTCISYLEHFCYNQMYINKCIVMCGSMRLQLDYRSLDNNGSLTFSSSGVLTFFHNYGICKRAYSMQQVYISISNWPMRTRKIVKQLKYRVTGDNSKKTLCGYKISFKRTNMGLLPQAYIFNTCIGFNPRLQTYSTIANGQYCMYPNYIIMRINTCVVRGIAFRVRIS